MTRIVIDARLESGRAGGIEQAIGGLVAGLAAERQADFEVIVVGWRGLDGWLPRPPVNSNVRIETVAAPAAGRSARLLRRSVIGKTVLPHLATMRARVEQVRDGSPLESFDPDVIHFAHQRGERTPLPSVYEPWDLQHLHHPELFSDEECKRRERSYRALCDDAAIVVVHCDAVRRDLQTFYGIGEDRIVTVPMASVFALEAPLAEGEMAARRRALGVPSRYALFPAQCWPHKNHRRLVDALSIMRERGIEVPVVCSGATNSSLAGVVAAAVEAGVADLLVLPGRVSSADLRSLYEGAAMLIFPTLHEGFGLPIVEALDAGLPIACSHIDSLSELASIAARYFEPLEPESMAHEIALLWTDEDMNTTYRTLAKERARAFTWAATTQAYRSVYHRVASTRVATR